MVKKVSIWSTLEPLLYSEAKHLAKISKELKKAHTTVRKQLAIFEKIGLVKKEKKGRQTFYKLRRIPLFIDYLTILEKEKLIRRCREELVLKEIVECLHSFNNPILVFGSAVDSVKKARDVDLLVVGKFNIEKIKLLEKRLNLKFHVINVRSLREINEALKKEITKKHLIVQGSEELIKWLIS
ncbi:MAG: winged helix-turn-helix transcriptional regulator [Candidatus Aenigmarchaeota archaeon]|nr:winged helix-turn-helix transcriptional regulator [Candidatus Aenigmarchaeota archaeon]